MTGGGVLLYLHGFRSSPSSIKAQQLAAVVAAMHASQRPRLHIPMLKAGPAADIAATAGWIESNVGSPREALTIVGSSLGGFYATYLAERFGARAVLINPAMRPYDDLKHYIGPQTNMYTGETFLVTEGYFDELRALAVRRITRPERYLLLVQTGDEVLDYREAVAFYGGAFQYVHGGGDHSFQDFAAQIPAILRFADSDYNARHSPGETT
jgi:predicted esterase YcpF (UPF0227 family)